ncbi:unnamed protein product [Urochloa decumbens]|uniref:RRM domain-containing protein n=1 Tax=Urochloa decumbens TaxID=240449 RepID=A0ABC8XVH8_9POAL
MTASATDDGTSPAPSATGGETPAAADVGAAVEEGEEMNAGAAAAVEGHGEAEDEEDPEEQAEDEEDPEEQAEDVGEAEGDTRDVEAADGMEAAFVEPLVVLKPREDDETEELEEEKEELDEEPEEVEPLEEDPEEVEEGKEECNGAEEKCLTDRSVANDTNEISKQEHGKSGNINKDKIADQLSKVSDIGGGKSDDPQNSELVGGLEIFVDKLPKDCVEEDIAMAFSECGEVKSVRIIKNSSIEKNNDIAFVCYASIEAAKKALVGFKEGIELKGEKVRVSACQDNRTLYLGNICKGWTKDQATKVYLEHVPLSWDEDKIKGCCQQYGTIMKVELFQISKNMESETFSFVEFSSSKSALACVEGINNAKIVDGGFKLSACLARPKSGLKANSSAASEGATTSKKEKGRRAKLVVDKDSPHKLPKGNKNNLTSQTKEVLVKENSPSKLPNDYDTKLTSQGAAEVLQTSKPSEGKREVGKNKTVSVNQKPSKKARNSRNVHESQQIYQGATELQKSSSSKRKRKAGRNKNIHINERPLKKAHNKSMSPLIIYIHFHPSFDEPKLVLIPDYAGNADRSLRSKVYASDLEPHAGFIPPASRVHSSHAYDRRRAADYDIHPIDRHPYARETAASRSVYSGYTSHAGYEAGYTYAYPPPPPPSESYYIGNGSYIPRRGDY